MQRFLRHFSAKRTPQGLPIPASGQVPNNAGGYSWTVDDWTQLDRFLILGSEGGTYYATEGRLTRENAEAVVRCIQADGPRTIARIIEISETGRAPKNDPALFALALCAAYGSPETKGLALAKLPQVARIGTHLFHFLTYIEGFRGWGRAMRRSVGTWYNSKTPDQLALQLIKYGARDGWSHRDALRLAHPVPASAAHELLYHWATKEEPEKQGLEAEPPELLKAYLQVREQASAEVAVPLIRRHRLPREALPTELLTDARVWEALLDEMPMEAMIRNLATMTRVGLLAPMSAASRLVVERLRDQERLRKARLHPIKVLAALVTYQQGFGMRSRESSWNPVTEVVDALNDAFYLAFGNASPSGKRIVIGLDVSGSMDGGVVAGIPGMTPRVASAALSLVMTATEPDVTTLAFSDQLVPISISRSQRLDDVVKSVSGIPFGGTDCALPMIWATERGIKADAFVILTDSETWFGDIHPAQALRAYREKMGIPAKLIVVGMVANRFTIADPTDRAMLDVVGFDTAVPQIMADFIGGRL